jgi:hypothetical protein
VNDFERTPQSREESARPLSNALRSVLWLEMDLVFIACQREPLKASEKVSLFGWRFHREFTLVQGGNLAALGYGFPKGATDKGIPSVLVARGAPQATTPDR